MAQKNRVLANLKKAQRRRMRRVATDFQPPAELKVKRGLENRVINNYQKVLYGIESLFALAYQDDDRIDDALVALVLKAAIRDTRPAEPAARELLHGLREVRRLHSHLSQETWVDCLRVVYTSLCRHSSCSAGDVDYLRFTATYIR